MNWNDKIIYSLGIAAIPVICILIFNNENIIKKPIILLLIFLCFAFITLMVIHLFILKLNKINNIFDFIFVIIIGIMVFPFLNVQNVWSQTLFSAAISSFILTFYKLYNEGFLKDYNKKIQTDLSENFEKIIPIWNVIVTKPYYIEFGRRINDIDESTLGRILEIIIIDQNSYFKENKFIISLESYLKILNTIMENSQSLYCINKTLPIFWFSPAPSERKFVLHYASSVPQLQDIYRITVIDDKNQINSQFENVEKEIRNKYYARKKEYITWIFILLGSLISNENDDIIRMIREKDKESFDKYFKAVFDCYLKDNDKINNSKLIENFVRNSFKDDSVKNTQKFIEEELISDQKFCENVNKKIISLFYEITGDKGSLFSQRNNLLDLFKQRQIDYVEFGEVGVFFDNMQKPYLSFATVGDFSNVIEIRFLEPSLLAEAIKYVYDTISQKSLFRTYMGDLNEQGKK